MTLPLKRICSTTKSGLVVPLASADHATGKAHGHSPWVAAIEASTSRVRPIVLTAAAAILGMVPIAPTVFWGPMAFAIMGGLAVATVLIMIFLPALYVAWFRIRQTNIGIMREVLPS